jgi:hypothetical protein
MENLKQQFAIDYNRIERVIKNNMQLTDYSKNSFIQSLKRQLDNGKLLTTAQKSALKKMDTLGNFKRALKK